MEFSDDLVRKAPGAVSRRVRAYQRGRPTDGWLLGDRLTSVDQAKAGDVLIGITHHFKAENLYRVLDVQAELFHACYVEPDGVTPSGSDGGLITAVWGFQLAQEEWYKATSASSGSTMG